MGDSLHWHMYGVQLSYQITRGPSAVVTAAAWKFSGSSPALTFKFQRKKMLLSRSHVKIQYCGEPT